MNFSTFLLCGPSMNGGLYNFYSYMPKDLDVFKRNVESLNIAALKLPPENFDTSKIIDEWKAFNKKTNYLKNLLYVIPFAIVPIIFSTHVIACTAVIITTIALAALGFYRSYQADLQASAWPELSAMITQTKLTLFTVSLNQEFEKCVKHLTSLNRDNAKDFISAFFDEEKNPLVKTQSQKAVLRTTNEVFLFYPRLKADYNNFTKQPADSITAEQMAQNLEIFIRAYTAKDAEELKSTFPDVVVPVANPNGCNMM